MNQEYRMFTKPAERHKAFNTLHGILSGISADGVVDESEKKELLNWCEAHKYIMMKNPYSEIIPQIMTFIHDHKPAIEIIEDVKWLVNSLISEQTYYDIITSDIQRLNGMLHGLLADNVIKDSEMLAISSWLEENTHLIGVYPYDELNALLQNILEDGTITEQERDTLTVFISEFVNKDVSATIDFDRIEELKKEITVQGICMKDPNIEFEDKAFCFTGASERMSRSGFKDLVIENGGLFHDNVITKTDYLVVGVKGNPCWAFSCYGRKVEKAIQLRKEGKSIYIVNENDFWNSINEGC